MDKIYFLHIPKTAGTAFNEMFMDVVPDGRYFQHMESSGALFNEITNDGEPFYASGHFTFEATEVLAVRLDVFSMTILRNPVSHFVSHLKWVKAYGNPDNPKRRALIPDDIAQLSLELWETSLNDIDRLTRVLDCPIAEKLFDNLQTRYLTRSTDKSVDRDQLNRALDNFKKLNFVFALEDLSLATTYLSGIFPKLREISVSNSALIKEEIDFSNQRILDFYRFSVKYDAALYTHVRKRSNETFFICNNTLSSA